MEAANKSSHPVPVGMTRERDPEPEVVPLQVDFDDVAGERPEVLGPVDVLVHGVFALVLLLVRVLLLQVFELGMT